MRFTKTIAAAASIAALAFPLAAPAKAGGSDAIIAGALGFGVGTLFGNAVAQPRYVAPRPVYVAPQPVYVAPPPVVYEPVPVYYSPDPWTPDWYAYCGSRYRSFDPHSGSYLAIDGNRYLCR